ncbi:hypothetical protein T12_15328 [Trichinella patagoniensis]|uniref:Uncharacterized protein n=1 Tax=Trichinella patagoniensis TaxID=990121 RepID=A0A0V0Z7K2_9BILA|nr:hypothetical protein T12_15328 [Trichinella patagoniensis]
MSMLQFILHLNIRQIIKIHTVNKVSMVSNLEYFHDGGRCTFSHLQTKVIEWKLNAYEFAG